MTGLHGQVEPGITGMSRRLARAWRRKSLASFGLGRSVRTRRLKVHIQISALSYFQVSRITVAGTSIVI